MTYEQFIASITPNMLGPDGKFLGPEAGVNYELEGMYPEDAYKTATAAAPTLTGDFETDRENLNRNPSRESLLSTAWKTGPDNQGGMMGSLGRSAESFAKSPIAPLMLAGLGAGMYANGAFGSLGETLGATATPVTGGSVTGTALAPFGAEGISGYSFGSGIGGDLLASTPGFESALSGGALGSTGIGSSLGSAGSAMSGIGSLLKDNAGLAQLGGAALGALASGDTQTSASQSKDPWGPAQSYLKDNLTTNASMQDYYRTNPFSTEQKTAYQGLLNTLANNQMNAQGLLANASNFGKSSGGKMPAMTGLLSGTQAPIVDWSQYANIGRK